MELFDRIRNTCKYSLFKNVKGKDRATLFGVLAALAVISIGIVTWYVVAGSPEDVDLPSEPTPTSTPVTVDGECEFSRAIDGVCVNNDEEARPRIVTVMIENHTDARPQSGLVDASVVYEAPVESNYSRFLAIYPKTAEVEKLGPVRSARPYFLDWVSEYGDAMYMHVGGSNEALEKIGQYQMFDMNEFFRGWYFWRSKDRYAPHNTYTSSDMWNKAFEEYPREEIMPAVDAWKFEKSEPCLENCITQITATFFAPTYEAVWKYSTSTEKYDRYQMGRPHVDQDGRTITADTIIVQRVKTQVLDSVGRIAMDTVGSGEAIVFRDGKKITGTWKKESRTARTSWFDAEGNDIPLKAGTIWVEVVNDRGSVSFK